MRTISLSLFIITDKEEEVKGVSLSHSLQFSSACGTPEFTNFTAGFAGCLDYIFYQNNQLDVTQVCHFIYFI